MNMPFGIKRSSVKKIIQEIPKNAVKNGPKNKFPRGAMLEMGSPHIMSMGRDTIETNN